MCDAGRENNLKVDGEVVIKFRAEAGFIFSGNSIALNEQRMRGGEEG